MGGGQRHALVTAEYDFVVCQTALVVYGANRSNAVNDEAILDYGSLESLLASPCGNGEWRSVKGQDSHLWKVRTRHTIAQ
jgi:hypothetical protein